MSTPTITIIGSVDNGKSTLIGRLLMETASIHSAIIEKTKKICAAEGIGFEPAYLVDYIREEREQKSTREWALAELKIGSEKILIVDTPGQMALSKKMVSGLTQADTIVLILDVTEENYVKYNYYFRLLSFLNVRDYVVLVNKMDLIDYDGQKYARYLKRLKENIDFPQGADIIPVSALKGDNITERLQKMSWFDGETLKDCLKRFIDKKQNYVSQEVLFPIQDVMEKNGKIIALGKLFSGEIKKGDRLFLLDGSETRETFCTGIYHLDKECERLNLQENGALETADAIFQKGNLFTDSADNFAAMGGIKSRLYILEDFNLADKNLSIRYLKFKAGIKYLRVLACHTWQFEKIKDRLHLGINEFADVAIEFSKNIPFAGKTMQEELPQAKQIAIENNYGNLLAVGIITGPA